MVDSTVCLVTSVSQLIHVYYLLPVITLKGILIDTAFQSVNKILGTLCVSDTMAIPYVYGHMGSLWRS